MRKTLRSRMPYQKITDAVKTSIVEAFQRDEDYLEAARLLNVKRTTAHGIIRRFQETGVIVRPRGGARVARKKIDDEMKNAAAMIVEDYPGFTLKQINQELRRRQPQKPHISISFLACMFDGQLIKLKKLEDAPIERNSPVTKEQRRLYATWLVEEGVNMNIIYVDECGFDLFTRLTRGNGIVTDSNVQFLAFFK